MNKSKELSCSMFSCPSTPRQLRDPYARFCQRFQSSCSRASSRGMSPKKMQVFKKFNSRILEVKKVPQHDLTTIDQIRAKVLQAHSQWLPKEKRLRSCNTHNRSKRRATEPIAQLLIKKESLRSPQTPAEILAGKTIEKRQQSMIVIRKRVKTQSKQLLPHCVGLQLSKEEDSSNFCLTEVESPSKMKMEGVRFRIGSEGSKKKARKKEGGWMGEEQEKDKLRGWQVQAQQYDFCESIIM